MDTPACPACTPLRHELASTKALVADLFTALEVSESDALARVNAVAAAHAVIAPVAGELAARVTALESGLMARVSALTAERDVLVIERDALRARLSLLSGELGVE